MSIKSVENWEANFFAFLAEPIPGLETMSRR